MAAPKRGPADLPDHDRQELEAWLVEFDQQWGAGALPERARRLPPGSVWRLPALCEMVKIDLERQWALGNRLSLETYLQDYPELGNPGDVSADLIQAEYEVRKQFGAAADLDDYARRFPAQVDELRRLIAAGSSSLSFRTLLASGFKRSATRQRAHADTVQELPEQFGRYRILKRLGAGGMGSVYLAEDTRLKRKVALKVAHIGGSESRQVIERFYREAEAAAGLDHPYLCKVHDVGEIDNIHYLTMEYIEGTTLGDLIDGKSNLAQRQVAAIVGKLALALQEAHNKGVVHRDLKPANVMIKKTGQKAPVIVDFGLAQQLSAGGMRLTQTGQAMGTPYYMAIEQVKGDLDAIGPACDIYALGVILYELLTGVVPFDGPNPMVVIALILTQTPDPPSKRRPDLDAKLEAICLKAMAKEIKDRYASMAELAAALTDYLKAPTPLDSAVGLAPSPSRPASAPPGHQGSDTLMGQFFENNAASITDLNPKAKPVVPPVPEPQADSGDDLRRPGWPLIAASAAGFVALLLGIIIYVTTDKGQVKIDLGEPKSNVNVVVKQDGKKIADITAQPKPPELSPPPPKAATPAKEPEQPKSKAASPPSLATPAVEGTMAGEERDDNALKMKLCWCPKGSFRMGSPADEPNRETDEGPVNVTLSRRFWMGKFEVTQSQWQTIMGTTIKAQKARGGLGDLVGVGPDHPMYFVSHTAAEEFCRKFTESERRAGRLPAGWEYRLPTEAQWEYACRAGTTSATAFGSQLSSVDANFDGNHPYNGAAKGPYVKGTKPVGSYRPNAWGLQDMHGNVWEWCRDGYAEELAGGIDPLGASGALGRVTRGAGWTIVGRRCRSACRHKFAPETRLNHLGFRVARVPSGAPNALDVENAERAADPGEPPATKKSGARRLSHPSDAKVFLGKHYKVFPLQLTWHEARLRCQALGGHLAIVTSEKENRFLTSLVNEQGLGGVWLGATDEQVEGRWIWVDSSPLRYSNWSTVGQQPNNKQGIEHYMVLLTRFNGTWCDQPDDCRQEHPGFICQWD